MNNTPATTTQPVPSYFMPSLVFFFSSITQALNQVCSHDQGKTEANKVFKLGSRVSLLC